MDYVEALKNLKSDFKYSRKSPHKAILLLAIIEMYETNVLYFNKIIYDDTLQNTFLKVWKRYLRNERQYHPELFLPFWYLQTDGFWHLIPVSGQEERVAFRKEHKLKPSQSFIKECIRYATLDDDLYFLMTIPSGRSTLRDVLFETYTDLSRGQIETISGNYHHVIEYPSIEELDEKSDTTTDDNIDTNELEKQFLDLNEDLQLVLNIEYYTFLKKNNSLRTRLKEMCPTVYDLYDKITKQSVHLGDYSPSFLFVYENFLSDLKISLIGEADSDNLIDNINKAIEALYVKTPIVIDVEPTLIEAEKRNNQQRLNDESLGIKTPSGDRKGQPWTKEEEELITKYFQEGEDFNKIAAIVGRTEVAVKARLGKLGLIEYIYTPEENKPDTIHEVSFDAIMSFGEFQIENTQDGCRVFNKYSERVFHDTGNIVCIKNNLFHVVLDKGFLVTLLVFMNDRVNKGSICIKANSYSDLFNSVRYRSDYINYIENIIYNPIKEKCNIKYRGTWYGYDGCPQYNKKEES